MIREVHAYRDTDGGIATRVIGIADDTEAERAGHAAALALTGSDERLVPVPTLDLGWQPHGWCYTVEAAS